MKAKTYLITCNCPQKLGAVKTLIVQMRNIWKKYKNLYAELTSAPLAAASSTIKTGKKDEGKFNILGWNSVVKSKQQIAKAVFRLWVNCNRPKTGDTLTYTET